MQVFWEPYWKLYYINDSNDCWQGWLHAHDIHQQHWLSCRLCCRYYIQVNSRNSKQYEWMVSAKYRSVVWYLCKSRQNDSGLQHSGKLFYWSGAANSCANNINAYLIPLASDTYDTFPQDASQDYIYFCSSEYSSTCAHSASFNYFGNMRLGYDTKTNACRVRGVLAFWSIWQLYNLHIKIIQERRLRMARW